MPHYRKKPVVIEAMELTKASAAAVQDWIISRGGQVEVMPPQVMEAGGIAATHAFQVKTLEGTLWAAYGDWIIRGVAGEFYPCRDDIFRATYDALETR
jgi:hypothetical protein